MARSIFYDSLKKILFAFVAMMFVAPVFSATLPAGYTELEYLESDGSQYIDTRVSGFNTGDWNIYAKFMTTNTTQTSYATVFNAYSSENHNSYRVLLQSGTNGAYYVSANSKAGGGSVRVNEKPAGQIYEVTLRNNTFVFDGVTYDAPNNTGTTLPSDVTMKLFGRGASSLLWKGRIYSAWATKDGVMQYNLVPAKYVSGNTTTYGMYDLKNERFLTNSGTGTFIPGPAKCRNLFDGGIYARGQWLSDGTWSDDTKRIVGSLVPITPNTTYVMKINNTSDGLVFWNYAYFDADKTWIGNRATNGESVFSGVTEKTFNISNSNARYFAPIFAKSTDGSTSVDISNLTLVNSKVQIEQNESPTNYVLYCSADTIKIATTKYNEDAFADLVTTLNSAITKVTNIVDTTVAQASSIGTLATTKQDRPADGDCPAGRKCLLVTGTDGKPHWYLIQE